MLEQGNRLRIAREPHQFDQVNCYLWDFDDDGRRRATQIVEGERIERGQYVEPTFRLHGESAQQLMDDLWAAGFRPTEGRQSEGMASAQASHLADMRAIAFAKLNIEKPV